MTPYDEDHANTQAEIATYFAGKAPERLLQMAILIETKRDCYLAGVAHAHSQFEAIARRYSTNASRRLRSLDCYLRSRHSKNIAPQWSDILGVEPCSQ